MKQYIPSAQICNITSALCTSRTDLFYLLLVSCQQHKTSKEGTSLLRNFTFFFLLTSLKSAGKQINYTANNWHKRDYIWLQAISRICNVCHRLIAEQRASIFFGNRTTYKAFQVSDVAVSQYPLVQHSQFLLPPPQTEALQHFIKLQKNHKFLFPFQLA